MAIVDEFEGAQFGDARLSKRLLRMVESLAPDPSASFPDAAGSDASLEATYRFLGNEAVSPAQIVAPHIAATVRRCVEAHEVVVAHDTTEVAYEGKRQGLGRLNDKSRGYLAHVALAVRADGSREPLGVLGIATYTRQSPREQRTDRLPEEERESFRWKQMVHEVTPRLRGRAELVHVMDSEADAFPLLASLVEQQDRFVVRLRHNRVLQGDNGQPTTLAAKLDTLQAQCRREVNLSTRSASHRIRQGRKRNLTRSSRPATLALSATSVSLPRPRGVVAGPELLQVHIVHVQEVDPPPGVEPVDWKLVTTEPIRSAEDLERIVDFYRCRWVIEEFFKSLKTGCALEKRQLESLPALLNALAIFLPFAFELLRLRAVARERPETPASAVLRPLQIRILERYKHTRLPPHATARQALLAVARLGGHIKNNGDPGWIVLGRGYEKLLIMEEGALVALEM
jgi:hypothetical protein